MRVHQLEPAPRGWKAVLGETVAHPDDRNGSEVYTLLRHETSGVYRLLHGGALRSCPQDWAARVAGAEGEPRRPGPRPTIAEPEKLTCIVERDQLAAVDAYAESRGIDRSKAVRELLERGLTRGDEGGEGEA